MNSRRSSKPTLASVFVLAAACSDTEVRPGVIEDLYGSLKAEVFASFQVDVPDNVVVYTFGNSCYSLGRTDVTVDGLLTIIEPYDRVDFGPCPDIPIEIRHAAELTFGTAGTATIRFVGLRLDQSLWTVDRTLPVNE